VTLASLRHLQGAGEAPVGDARAFERRRSRFSGNLLASASVVILLAIAFGFYVRSERLADKANDLRHKSLLLADELRQSSDDLTRMVRTYVITGDVAYKQHYQDILDIRDGKKPRPQDYQRVYWDLVLPGGQAPRPDSPQAIGLLELMRQTGFTEEEFGKLAEAKANSDGLTGPEFEAMKLVESTGPDTESNRLKARMMMHDAKYHQAKAAIMKPIDEFFVLMDNRTSNAVRTARDHATVLLYAFIALALALLLMLWRAYAALSYYLGGSLDEIHQQIVKLGSGDFSSAVEVNGAPKDHVLGWLSETQGKLNDIDREVSHDLRAPLRAIEGFSAKVVERYGSQVDAEGQRLLGVVRANARKMARLIDDLLAFSRTGRSEMHYSRLNMEDMARSAFGEVAPDPELRARIDFRFGDLPEVDGDAALLKQVWINLLSNAVKFSAGREDPAIEIEGAVEGIPPCTGCGTTGRASRWRTLGSSSGSSSAFTG
jgi:signal transduction histidine kinase